MFKPVTININKMYDFYRNCKRTTALPFLDHSAMPSRTMKIDQSSPEYKHSDRKRIKVDLTVHFYFYFLLKFDMHSLTM